MSDLTDLADEIYLQEESDSGPAPSDYVRLFEPGDEEIRGDFYPEYDRYVFEIKGYCTWGRKALDLPDDEIENRRWRLRRDFFTRLPAYGKLQPRLTEAITPEFYVDYSFHEELRLKLVRLYEGILEERRRKQGQSL